MSVWPKPGYEIPLATVRVAKAAFRKGSLAMRVRDELGELFADKDFEALFATRGRPGVSPARLVLVSVLQFVEGLTDRQAAHAVRGRLDWKYALGLELTDPGFDASVLTEFRGRLCADGQAERLLTLMCDRLRERGLLTKGGTQRTDATCVTMAVRDLNRLEQVAETVRAVLEVLAAVAPAWLAGWLPEHWYARYGQRGDDWRLPTTDSARTALAVQIGQDGFTLLSAVYAADLPWLAEIEAVDVLRQTWIQQYYRDSRTDTHRVVWRTKANTKAEGKEGTKAEGKEGNGCGLPPGARMILSPYDVDARIGVKRGTVWRGYKAHFTETCNPGTPHLIVHVATTDAATADIDTVTARHDDLAGKDLLPKQHLADAAYISIGQVQTAAEHHQVQLIGPVSPDTSWQATTPDAFDLTKFAIDFPTAQVVCPHGKTNIHWQQLHDRGRTMIRARFSLTDCRPCPDRTRCTRADGKARHLTFHPEPGHQLQQHLRQQQATPQWRQQYALRAGVEALIAQASHRSDIHHARYRGKPKTFLQHVLTAIAINLIRINAWYTNQTAYGSWTSHLTRLANTLTTPG